MKSFARKPLVLLAGSLLLAHPFLPGPLAYELNRTVADKRNAANAALGTCPSLDRFNTTLNGIIDRRWNTTLGANIRTNPPAGQTPVEEIRSLIARSFDAWIGVTGTTLKSSAFGPLNENSAFSCNSFDGLNTICFSQNDPGFTAGVLGFTNTVTSDILGEQFAGQQATFIGEILDADVLINPNAVFSTPAALSSNPSTFDLESVLTHELGHMFGLSHSGVWRAMMYPFAPTPGSFTGDRPIGAVPDGPLAEDDRTGLRVLYPDPSDTVNIGVIEGRVLPANPISFAGLSGVTGIFGAHVVAVDDATGGVIGAAVAGWSCSGAGPVAFDGAYRIERLPLNRSYKLYAEPLDGPVTSSAVAGALDGICRPYASDTNYPAQFSCTRPGLNTNFVTRTKP